MPKATGAVRLRQWLTQERMSQREFAALATVHWTYINQLVSGRRTPGLAAAVNLQALTGIPVTCWTTPQENRTTVARRMARAKKRARTQRLAARQPAAETAPPVTTDESAPV